jgi:hypothetical protein
MKVIAFITGYAVVDRIIDHLKLRFVAIKPSPPHVFTEVALMAAWESGNSARSENANSYIFYLFYLFYLFT